MSRLPYRHTTEIALTYLTAFILVAFVYAILSAFTSIFYKKKKENEYSWVENQIRTGKATFGQRVTLFWHSLFGSIVVLNCYIVAAALTASYWLYLHY
jgi:hypothetical protein